MSHVRRWPTERKYTLSTIGAHRIFRLNGHEARLKMPCSAYVAPFSCRMKLTLALKPMGTPCRVYSNSRSATLP